MSRLPVVLRRLRLAAPLALLVTVADCTTKELVTDHLAPGIPVEVAGDLLQFTLVFNTGAAMGLPLGEHPRPVLLLLGAAILALLARHLWQTPPTATAHRVALGLVLGGAFGNYLSRLWSPRGVVDFINVGVGDVRFWVFNIADIGVCVGACLLFVVLWRAEARRQEPAAA